MNLDNPQRRRLIGSAGAIAAGLAFSGLARARGKAEPLRIGYQKYGTLTDAWAIWDPFLAAAEKQLGARVLADGRGVVSNHQFYLASRGYAERRPQAVVAIVDELAKLDVGAAKHTNEVAQLLGPQIGLDVGIAEVAATRFAYGIRPITAAVAAEQQKIADAFFELKLIPKPVRIADALPSARVALGN